MQWTSHILQLGPGAAKYINIKNSNLGWRDTSTCLIFACWLMLLLQGLPRWCLVKNLPANAGDTRDAGSVSGWERFPQVGNGNPLQYSCHGQRNLMGYSSWGCKELGTIEWVYMHTQTHTHIFIWQRTVKGRFWTITWKWKSLSCVWLIVTPWTIQSMEFSRPEHWSGPLFPSPGDLPNPGIEPRCPVSQEDSLPAEPPGKP